MDSMEWKRKREGERWKRREEKKLYCLRHWPHVAGAWIISRGFPLGDDVATRSTVDPLIGFELEGKFICPSTGVTSGNYFGPPARVYGQSGKGNGDGWPDAWWWIYFIMELSVERMRSWWHWIMHPVTRLSLTRWRMNWEFLACFGHSSPVEEFRLPSNPRRWRILMKLREKSGIFASIAKRRERERVEWNFSNYREDRDWDTEAE